MGAKGICCAGNGEHGQPEASAAMTLRTLRRLAWFQWPCRHRLGREDDQEQAAPRHVVIDARRELQERRPIQTELEVVSVEQPSR